MSNLTDVISRDRLAAAAWKKALDAAAAAAAAQTTADQALAQAGTGLPPGQVSVASYMTGSNGSGNGTTLDDSAFLLARDTGANVYIPSGTLAAPKKYLLSQTIAINPAQRGQKWYSNGFTYQTPADGGGVGAELNFVSTCLLFTGQTNFLFDIKTTALIKAIMVFQHPSYVPTAGGHFWHNGGSGTTTNVNGTDIEGCLSWRGWDGFYASGNILMSRIRHCHSTIAKHANYRINILSPYGDVRWMDLFSTGSPSGLLVNTADTGTIHGFHHNAGSGMAINFAADTGAIDNFGLDKVTVEGMAQAVQIGNDVGSYTSRVTIRGMEVQFSYAAGGGQVVMGAHTRYCDIDQGQWLNTTYLDKGSSNKLRGVDLSSSGVVTAGVGIDLQGSDATVANCHVRDRAAALNFGANGNYASLVGNNFRLNNTAVLAAGSNAAAKATGRGSSNIVLADW